MKKWVVIIVQLFGLYLINKLGYLLVDSFHLPLPGNVMGMVILLFLLSVKIVPLKWIEAGSGVLIKHLAFFFIPIAVGLMNYGSLFLHYGVTLFVVIFGSIILGIFMTSAVSQFISRKKEGVVHETIDHTA